MFAVFAPLRKRLSNYLKYKEITTENFAFRLHCVFTAAVLLSSSILLTTTQVVGSPILCLSGNSKWHHPIETYCWVKSTFTMPDWYQRKVQAFNFAPILQSNQMFTSDFFKHHRTKRSKWILDHEVGKGMAYPGVMNEHEGDGPKKYYPFYQWVCFVLFFQAILCYVPKVLWDQLEGGLQATLATGLSGFCSVDDKKKKIEYIISYLIKYKKKHTSYTIIYLACEVLCLVNVLGQMWLMDTFLDGQFWTFGTRLLSLTHLQQHERNDTLIFIFPRVTKCQFYYYGPSGGIVNLDNMCVLPQNVINEKIYIVLWFWYNMLAVVFGGLLLYRMVILCIPRARPQLLALRAKSRSPYVSNPAAVISNLSLGEWWMLYMLGKNMHPLIYRDLTTQFAERIEKPKKLFPQEVSHMPLWPQKSSLNDITR